MRHRRHNKRLAHSKSLSDRILVDLTLALLEHHRITTTVAKAKALRPFVEKIVTRARRGTDNDRRVCLSRLKGNSQHTNRLVEKLFASIGPANANRNGGYTRILKLGPRASDSAPMALIEFVETIAAADTNAVAAQETAVAEAKAAAPAKKAAPKKATKPAANTPATTADAPADAPAKKPRAKKAAPKKDSE